jgi:hypothetical protein
MSDAEELEPPGSSLPANGAFRLGKEIICKSGCSGGDTAARFGYAQQEYGLR